MKILQLRFQNLNSLRGASEINFESGPLGAAGLFAITGPTGAGKSTLLDAMTLALYGKAARYGSQPSPETMMSRHTGECFAELEFSCAGGRFRSSWHLQRAHRKPGGKLQSPKRRVIALPGETVLSEKNDESGRLIEQLTGLDYERFLRSVMLAQGDFAAFLKAKPDERANLLEQVTGTSLYRDISIEAFRRFTLAKSAHELLLGQSANIQVLDTAERERRQADLAQLAGELGERRKAMTQLQTRLQAVQRWQAWEQAERQRVEALQGLESECVARQPELARLALGEKARALAPALAGVDREQAQVLSFSNSSAALKAQLPSLSEGVTQAQAALDKAVLALEQERQAQEHMQALWLRVQQLDTQADACLLASQPLERQSASLQAELTAATATLSAQTRELAEIASVLRKGHDWLEANAGDACLADLDAPSRQASQAWAHCTRRVAEATKRIQSLETDFSRQRRAVESASQALAQSLRKLESPQQAELQSKAALAALLPSEGLPGLESAVVEARRRRESTAALLEQARRLTQEESRVADCARDVSEAETLLVDLDAKRGLSLRQRELLDKVFTASRQAVVFAERCAALVQERPLLQDGHACPLCGATQHPWAERHEEDSGELAKAHVAEREADKELRLHDQALLVLQTQHAAAQERAVQARRAKQKAVAEAAGTRAGLSKVQTFLALPPELPALSRCEALFNEASQLEQDLERRLQDCRKAHEANAACTTEVRRLEASRDAAAASLASQQALQEQLASQLTPARAAFEEASKDEILARQAALQLLQSLAFPPDSDQAAYSLFLDTLQQRARLYARALQKVQDQQQKQLVLELASKTLADQVEKLRAAHTELLSRLSLEREKLAALRTARTELFGDQSIEVSRLEARTRLAGITKVTTNAETLHREARSSLLSAEQNLARLGAEIVQAENQVRILAAGLAETSSEAGFADIVSLRAALLSQVDFDSLSLLQRSLAGRRAALDAEAVRLQREHAQLPSGCEADAARTEALRLEHSALELASSEASKAMGAHEECIRMDDTNRARLGTLLAETEAAHREFSRWDALRALIGSADGSLFARFAQGLTLDRLAWLANTHLAQLNPRYSVRRSRGQDAKDLELEIMDHFQADVVRPMGSLSGGESFLVSLALALALSELASGKSAIESLFIDEGFGSLDADTLEAAMAALEGLQSRGKTIGVISHVAVMQERIATQIRVIKESGGCSRILVVG